MGNVTIVRINGNAPHPAIHRITPVLCEKFRLPAPRHYCRCKTCRAARRPTPRTDG